MRILVLGAPGPYPERLRTFRAAGHHLWWVSTLLLPPPEQLTGVTACHLWDLARTPEAAVERLVELIDTERIDAVYSLLNVWDGSQQPTALLLRRGSPVSPSSATIRSTTWPRPRMSARVSSRATA
jgi:hypothetical protein